MSGPGRPARTHVRSGARRRAGGGAARWPGPALLRRRSRADVFQPRRAAADRGQRAGDLGAIRDDAPVPALVAGYSVGELAAYGVAGALGAADVVQLADIRARAMDECQRTHPGQALAAISGLTLARAVALMAEDLFYVAIETADDSCIAGGPAAGLPALEQKVLAAGGRLTRLPVEVASHTPYLAAAVAPFAAALRQADFRPFAAPVLSGAGALRVDGKALAVEQLSRQLAETIAWRGCMDACAEAGITVALELGPGAALARMMQARHPHIACRSVADFRSLAGVRRWLEQHCF